MTEKCLGGCKGFALAKGVPWSCCGSCHDDEDNGYGCLLERYESGTDDYWSICCAMDGAVP